MRSSFFPDSTRTERAVSELCASVLVEIGSPAGPCVNHRMKGLQGISGLQPPVSFGTSRPKRNMLL